MNAKISLGVALALSGAVLSGATSAMAHEPITAQTLIDRAEITDLLTRYYNHFGPGTENHVADYFTADAEMVMSADHFKGIEAIKDMYRSVPANAPQRTAYGLNIVMGNPLIVINGDTATARMTFTEFMVDNAGDKPRVHGVGREFDWLVKQDGKWLLKKRQIMDSHGIPEGWTD